MRGPLQSTGTPLGIAALLLLASLPLLAGCPTGTGDDCEAGLLPGDLVITEIMADPDGTDSGKEWIEIFNATGDDIELTGVQLVVARVDGTNEDLHVFAGLTVPGGEYVVLSSAAEEALPEWADYAYGSDLSLRQDGGMILIRSCEEVIDETLYVDPDEGRAKQYSGAGAPDAIGNDDQANWCNALSEYEPGSFGTPGTVNDPCSVDGQCRDGDSFRPMDLPQTGDLLITEIMPDPSVVGDAEGEWFEVWVGADVDLNGLEIGTALDDLDVVVDELDCVSVPADSYLLFARNIDPAFNGGLPKVDFNYDFSMGNSGGELHIVLAGTPINSVVWTDSVSGVARSLDPDFITPADNGFESNWCNASDLYGSGDFGTPGAENPYCVLPGLCFDNAVRRAAVAPSAGEVVITEIMPDPSGADGDKEWFELLVTPAAGTIDLNGLELGDTAGVVDQVIGSQDCIPVSAPTRFVFASSDDPLANGGLPRVDFLTDFSFTNASGLLHAGHGGTVLDEISWTGSTSGASLSLDPDFEDAAGNDTAGNWCDGTLPYGDGDLGTPGDPNPFCAMPGSCIDGGVRRITNPPLAGDIVISEVMANPSTLGPDGEWVELWIDPAAGPLDLNELELGNDSNAPADQIVAQADCITVDGSVTEYVVVAESDNPALNGGLPQVDIRLDFGLTDSNSEFVVWHSGVELDTVNWLSSADGVSFGVDPDFLNALDNDDLAHRCPGAAAFGAGDLGSPGAANPYCAVPGLCFDTGVRRATVPADAAGALAITEVHANPSGTDSGKEWFELYMDPGGSPVDLNGVELTADTSGPVDQVLDSIDCLTISSAGYYVFAQGDDPLSNGGLPNVDFLVDFSLGNSSGGLSLGFGGVYGDQVSWTNAPDGATLSLDPDFENPVDNDDPQYWCPGTDVYGDGDLGTPGTANPYCALSGMCFDGGVRRSSVTIDQADAVVITEVLANPSGTDGVKEWFEVYVDPTTAGSVDLNGLELSNSLAGSTDQTVGGLDCIPVSAPTWLVFAGSDDPAANGGLAVVDEVISFSLGNTSGELSLRFGGQVVDETTWTGASSGASFSLDPEFRDSAGNDDSANWCLGVDAYGDGDLGTPGSANPFCLFPGVCFDGPARRPIVPPVSGEVLINEVMANPSGADAGKEWFELSLDPLFGGFDLNELGLSNASGTVDMTISNLNCIRIGVPDFALFAASDDPGVNAGLPMVDSTINFELFNSSGEIEVSHGGVALDLYSWTNAPDGTAQGRDQNGLFCSSDLTYGANADFGTPRAANSPDPCP